MTVMFYYSYSVTWRKVDMTVMFYYSYSVT